MGTASPQQINERHCGGRCACLGSGNHVDEHIPLLPSWCCAGNGGKIVGNSAIGPVLRAPGPDLELRAAIACLHLVGRSLQAGIDEFAGDIGDRRMLLGIDERQRNRMLARELDESNLVKARMSRFDRMTYGVAIDAVRQELEKSGEVVRLEFFRGVELPEYRPELATQFQQAAGEETLDRSARLG